MTWDTDGRSLMDREESPVADSTCEGVDLRRRGPLRCQWFSCTNMSSVIDNDVYYCGSCWLRKHQR